ncbi:hypothetical protein PFISCL1PPCAC_28301, partial [Pristionchus fissidentatus]
STIAASAMLLQFVVGLASLFYLPFIFSIVLLVIFLSATGLTLGIRKRIAHLLIAIFEWGSDVSESEEQVSESVGETREETAEEQPAPIRKRHSSSDLRIIKREHSELIDSKLLGQDVLKKKSTVSVLVDDSLDFISAGIESIIEDNVTSRFSAEQLPSWNLLSRTKYTFMHISPKLTILWILGFYFRYLILVPIRVCLFCVGMASMVFITSAVGYVPNKAVKKWLNRRAMLTSMRIFSRSFSSIVNFHDRHNRATQGGICVANHTSPMDVMILSCDNCYAMVGQKQGGILGFIQKSLSKAEHHIWFERSEAKDRMAVSNRMREHVEDPTKLPIIIFPEGTCINNTSVMMFKKGSFEISETIYPVAMKYDSRLGDAFWNSSKQSYGEYMWMMMTSWAITADVWYLPPMTRMEGEDSIAFARRVKKAIAKAGGLVDLEWDGALKREKVSNKLIALQQKLYFERLSTRTSMCSEITDDSIDILKNMSEDDRNQLFKCLDEADDDNAVIRKVSEFIPEVAALVTEAVKAEE